MGTAPLHLRLLRVLSWHRRKIAAGLAAIAVAAGINAAAPPAPPTASVVVTTRAVAAGATVVAADLETVRRPRDQLPDAVVADPGVVVGRLAVAALPRGQLVTDLSTLGPRQVASGRVIAPLRLADPELAASLRPGDVVDVVAADEQDGSSAVVARAVRVVTVPQPATEAGLLGSGASTGGGALCLVEVDRAAAAALAGAAVRRQLSVLWAR